MQSKKNKYKRIIIKIGSNVLTAADGTLDTERMASLAEQLATSFRAGIEIVVVSSGAVASGRGELNVHKKLDPVSARQLYSAVGQAKLLNSYYHLFKNWNIDCGQVLTTKESLSTREHYLNQKNCMEVMLANRVIPIVNENDAISVTELMFTDNDELSGMVATMMNADALVILSNIDGIYNGNPADPNTTVIREIKSGKNNDVAGYISAEKSNFGRGGMLTKARIARKVADEGIEVIIANGKTENILVDLIVNNIDVVCTRFAPAAHAVSGVKKWIAHSDGFAKGAVHINQGAFDALKQPKAASLLPVGVERIEGSFEKNDIVQIISPKGENIGVGRVTVSAEKAQQLIGKKGGKPFIHYNYLYLSD